MSLEGFIIDTESCIVELRGGMDVSLYERFSCPDAYNSGEEWSQYLKRVMPVFADRAMKQWGRPLSVPETVFITNAFMLCRGYPALMLTSLIDQMFYWRGINPDVVYSVADND